MQLLLTAINDAIADTLNALQPGSANTLWEQQAAFVHFDNLPIKLHRGEGDSEQIIATIDGPVTLLFANNGDHTPIIAALCSQPVTFDSGAAPLRWRGRLRLTGLGTQQHGEKTALVLFCILDGALTRPVDTVPVPTEPTVNAHVAEVGA